LWHCCLHCLHHNSEANQPEDHKYSSLYFGFNSQKYYLGVCYACTW
jgi:hypothetical protein